MPFKKFRFNLYIYFIKRFLDVNCQYRLNDFNSMNNKKLLPVFLFFFTYLSAHTQPITTTNGKIVLANAEVTKTISSSPADTSFPYNWGFEAVANITYGKSLQSGNQYIVRLNSINFITANGFYYKQKYDKKYPGKYYPCSMFGSYCTSVKPSRIALITIWEYNGKTYNYFCLLNSQNYNYTGVNSTIEFPRANGEIPNMALKNGQIVLKDVKLEVVSIANADDYIKIIRAQK